MEIVRSKKFWTMIAGLIVIVSSKLGLNLSEQTILEVIGLLSAYIVGQGIADNGKEAAKIQK